MGEEILCDFDLVSFVCHLLKCLIFWAFEHLRCDLFAVERVVEEVFVLLIGQGSQIRTELVKFGVC